MDNTRSRWIQAVLCLLLCFVLCNAVAKAERNVTLEQYNGGKWLAQFAGDPFGNDNVAWRILFLFKNNYLEGEIAMDPKRSLNIPIRSNDTNNIVITFNTSPRPTTMTIPFYYTNDSNAKQFSFDLRVVVVTPLQFDYLDSSPGDIACYNISTFISYPISSIKINDVLLPGPYPSRNDFLKLFDAGVGKFPASSWYAKYRSDRKGKSSSGSSKTSNSNSSSKKSANTQITKPAQPARPTRPAILPTDFIETTAAEFRGCHYDDYNCYFFKRPGPKSFNLNTPTLAELLAHPLGIKELNWTKNEASVFQQISKTGLPVRGFYKHVENPSTIRTRIEFPADIFLPIEFYYNSHRIYFSTHEIFDLPHIDLCYRSYDNTFREVVQIDFHLRYDSYPMTKDVSKRQKDHDKINKEIKKRFRQMIDNLKKKGYDFKKIKFPYEAYEFTYPNKLTCSFFLRIEKYDATKSTIKLIMDSPM